MNHEPNTSTKPLIHTTHIPIRLQLLAIDPKLNQFALKTHMRLGSGQDITYALILQYVLKIIYLF